MRYIITTMATCDLSDYFNQLNLNKTSSGIDESFEEIHIIHPICLGYMTEEGKLGLLPRYWICNASNFIDPFCHRQYLLLETADIIKMLHEDTAVILRNHGKKISFEEIQELIEEHPDCFVITNQKSRPFMLRKFKAISIPFPDIHLLV